MLIQGKPPDFNGTAPSWLRVGPHYFQTIGTRLLGGRLIDERDGPGAPRVSVVNDAFARRYFPKENGIGYSFGMSDLGHSGDYEIVGIVEDAKYQDARGPAYPTFFLPLLQVGTGEPLRGWASSIELHVAGRPENLEPSVRRAIAEVDPNLTVLRMASFDEQVARNFNSRKAHRATGGAVWGSRFDSGVRGPIQRHSLCCGTTNERDRYPDSGRRRAHEHSNVGVAERDGTSHLGPGHRYSCCAGRRTLAGRSALRRADYR